MIYVVALDVAKINFKCFKTLVKNMKMNVN